MPSFSASHFFVLTCRIWSYAGYNAAINVKHMRNFELVEGTFETIIYSTVIPCIYFRVIPYTLCTYGNWVCNQIMYMYNYWTDTLHLHTANTAVAAAATTTHCALYSTCNIYFCNLWIIWRVHFKSFFFFLFFFFLILWINFVSTLGAVCFHECYM